LGCNARILTPIGPVLENVVRRLVVASFEELSGPEVEPPGIIVKGWYRLAAA
jgi:hypothetical protein